MRVASFAVRRTVRRLLPLLLGAVSGCAESPSTAGSETMAQATPVAVLGNSDSHSYGDTVLLADSALRGGVYRQSTFQWTEIWDRFRREEIDLGPWAIWGTRGRVATIQRFFGVAGRAPRKLDFRHNFALSGAQCSGLNQGMSRQITPLLDLVAADSARWARGLVIIRIGVNSFGQPKHLDRFAAGEPMPAVDDCVRHIRDAVAAIHAQSPTLRIVLVGIFNNVDWAKALEQWQDPIALARIEAGLEPFDRALRTMAEQDARIAFHDDRAWVRRMWGGRDATGRPAYRAVTLGGGFTVTNTAGDSPEHMVLLDGHMGTVGNALWLNSVIEAANQKLGTAFTPIRDDEILSLLPKRE